MKQMIGNKLHPVPKSFASNIAPLVLMNHIDCCWLEQSNITSNVADIRLEKWKSRLIDIRTRFLKKIESK